MHPVIISRSKLSHFGTGWYCFEPFWIYVHIFNVHVVYIQTYKTQTQALHLMIKPLIRLRSHQKVSYYWLSTLDNPEGVSMHNDFWMNMMHRKQAIEPFLLR